MLVKYWYVLAASLVMLASTSVVKVALIQHVAMTPLEVVDLYAVVVRLWAMHPLEVAGP